MVITWFGTNANLKKLQRFDLSLHVGADTIVPADAVRDLGVILYGELIMIKHFTKLLASATATFGA